MENVRRFPRRGGRGLCVHGTVSFHRAGSRHMLAAQKPDPDSHRTLRPVVDPDTAWSVIALVNLAKVTHTNFRRAYLLPLMCGATNVTMDSNQLSDVLVPIPERSVQDEVVESHLIRTRAAEMLSAAKALCQISTDPTVISFTERVIKDLADVLQASANKATVEDFLPKRGIARSGFKTAAEYSSAAKYRALLKFVWVAKASRRQALNLQVLDFVDLVGLRLRI